MPEDGGAIARLERAVDKLAATVERLDERVDSKFDSERLASDRMYVSKQAGPFVRQETYDNKVREIESGVSDIRRNLRYVVYTVVGFVTGTGGTAFAVWIESAHK